MRRCLLLVCLFGGILFFSPSQAVAQETQQQETAALDTVTLWKIANTAIFVIGLGFLIAKYAPAFFNARSLSIQKAIQDATGLRIEAEFRYSEIDRKMASLPSEIQKLRQQAALEAEREHRRFRHETEVEISHIWHNTQAEIEGFRQEAIRRIRRHTAQLAIRQAERSLRDRFSQGEPDELLQDFIHLVGQGKN